MKIAIFLLSLFFTFSCENSDPLPITQESILGNWEVVEIIEDGILLQKESITDSIGIEFQMDGKIYGNSSRNLLLGSYELSLNNSIWISTIGGTEVNGTKWEKSFKSVIPKITQLEQLKLQELSLFTNDRSNSIKLEKSMSPVL